MNLRTFLLAFALGYGASALGAEAEPPGSNPAANEAAQPDTTAKAETATERPAPAPAAEAEDEEKPAEPPADAAATPPPASAPAAVAADEKNAEAPPVARDAPAEDEEEPAPTTAREETTKASPAENPVAVDAAPTAPPAAEASTPVAPPADAADIAAPAGANAPAAPPPVTQDAIEARAELIAARVSLMEQLLLAQHHREVELYRTTIRMITMFGGAFAGLCMIGLLAAAFLNYRALMAVQSMYARVPGASAATDASPNGLLAAPAAETVPGIERVQASGQRFQSHMTGLEQRLAELEHLAGRDSAAAGPDRDAIPAADDVMVHVPVRRVVPRAMILVHKAQAQANLGKLSEALSTLDEAAGFEGANTEVHLARGQVLEKLGRLGDALKAYESAVDADTQNTSALLLKAGVLNRQERFSEALACYERALEVHRASV